MTKIPLKNRTTEALRICLLSSMYRKDEAGAYAFSWRLSVAYVGLIMYNVKTEYAMRHSLHAMVPRLDDRGHGGE